MPDLIPLVNDMDRFARRLSCAMQARGMSCDPMDLGQLGRRILMCIHSQPGVSMLDLAAHMARDKSQMTRAVTALEDKGLVSRSPRPEDRRVQELRLTSEGADLAAQLQRVLASVLEEVLAPISPADRDTFARVMHLLAMQGEDDAPARDPAKSATDVPVA